MVEGTGERPRSQYTLSRTFDVSFAILGPICPRSLSPTHDVRDEGEDPLVETTLLVRERRLVT